MLNEYVTENREEEAKITKQAIELHAEVLAEYHRKSALEQAIATGAIPAPKTDMTQLPLNEPVPGGPPSGTERPVTDPEKVLEAQEHAGWLPLDRFEAMERDLAVVKRAVLAVLGTVTAGDVLARVTGEPPEVTVLVSEPTGWDWDAMYEAGISG